MFFYALAWRSVCAGVAVDHFRTKIMYLPTWLGEFMYLPTSLGVCGSYPIGGRVAVGAVEAVWSRPFMSARCYQHSPHHYAHVWSMETVQARSYIRDRVAMEAPAVARMPISRIRDRRSSWEVVNLVQG